MIISLNWLKQFVKLPANLDPQTFADDLVMHVAEVDRWWRQDDYLDGVVVGKVVSVKKHPDADRLKLCTVSDGKKKYPVVCGGANVVEGMMCAFAPVGSRVKWHGDEEVVLQKIKIRGKASEGMMCAAAELGIAVGNEPEKEIMDLSHLDVDIGIQLATALEADDIYFEIDNKSINNRADLWGHVGVAREVAAMYGIAFTPYKSPAVPSGKPWSLSIKNLSTKLCPRYQGVVVENINVEPSPEWMQRRLKACGIKAINNVVDVTNYVLLESGQPMHAFDLKKLENNDTAAGVTIRLAKKGEKIKGLDEESYKLTDQMLVIADKKQPVAIAGVMGGFKTGVSEKTKSILFEAANFDPTSVRKTAQALGIRTESSTRFEKTLDPTQTSGAIARAVELLQELCPDAVISSPVADAGNAKVPKITISLATKKVNAVLGAKIPTAKIKSILIALGCSVRTSGTNLSVAIPSWRAMRDVSVQEDLIEEIGRLWGYENIEPKLPQMSVAPPLMDPIRATAALLRRVLVEQFSFSEVRRHAFISDVLIEKMGGRLNDHVAIESPLSADQGFLRRSLAPSNLVAMEQELHNADNVSFFEIGKTFLADAHGERVHSKSDKYLPKQEVWCMAMVSVKEDQTPFYQVRRIIEQLSTSANNWELLDDDVPLEWTHPGRRALISVDGVTVGWIAELHPGYARTFGIDQRVGMLSLNVDVLSGLIKTKVGYTQLPTYPPAKRDIALLVDRAVTHSAIMQTLSRASDLLIDSQIFDMYEGSKVSKGKKSMAYHLTYYSPHKTLAAEEVEKEHKKIIQALKKGVKASIR